MRKRRKGSINWALVDISTQESVSPNELAVLETRLNYPCPVAASLMTLPPTTTTPTTTPQPRPLTVLIFIRILFGILFGMIFVNEINQGSQTSPNENSFATRRRRKATSSYVENVELECEFVNCDFDFYNYGDLLNGYYPIPYPTPAPTNVDFIISRIGLREQLILKDEFDIFYSKNNICECKCGFNENCYNNGYYYPTTYPPKYPTPTSVPTTATIFIFDKTGNGLPGNNVDLCENIIINNINNEMNNNCMSYFWGIFFIFSQNVFSWFSWSWIYFIMTTTICLCFLIIVDRSWWWSSSTRNTRKRRTRSRTNTYSFTA